MYYKIILAIVILLSCSFNGQAQSKKKKKKNKGEVECTISVPTTMVWYSRDGLMVQSKCNLVKMDFKIYNRWGEVIYQANKAIIVQPGFYRLGSAEEDSTSTEAPKVETGVHAWQATYTFRGAEALEEKSAAGSLTVIK